MSFTSTRYFWKTGLFSVLFIIASIVKSYATHLRAGEITVERVNCGNLFKITITVYTNTKGTTVLFGGDQDELNFGDGSPTVLVPETKNTVRFDLDPTGAVATASFTTYHIYGGAGQFVISYREPNRNEGVLNMDASVNTTFYIETVINIDPSLGCNNSPKLRVPPIDHACPGVAWTHNPGAYDPEGDSLSYEMVIPFSDRNTTVVNYKNPNDSKFYNNYDNANENGDDQPTFSINPRTGTITWDAPGTVAIGEYNIAFHIVEWRYSRGQWWRMGYVRRDMQILVDDCDNERPTLEIPPDTCVVAGTKLEAIIKGMDPDNDNVKIEAFSEVFHLGTSPASYSPVPGVDDFRPQPVQTTFTWNTDCAHVKDQPYQVVFKITDNPPNGPKLVTFETWFITVVGPPPTWNDAQLNLSNRTATVKWDPYTCQNAETVQVWRKVDGTDFTPAHCETGMPQYLGYELITTVPASTTSFTDNNGNKGLAPGAKYCYRLVAVFPRPKGGESYVSVDTCVGPILADVPIITHVTVEKTSTQDGQIRVSWRKPFDVNTAQFPPPYRYDVYRAVGFARGSDSTLVTTLNGDTTYLDTGVNSEENVYNYSIAAYSPSNANAYLGSSVPASSVRLDTKSQIKKIELNWSAFVPWSNQIQTYPSKHLVYRGPEGATEGDLVLIDSVEVTNVGFVYVDEGQSDGVPLDDDKTYCYRVMTRGGYGNPKIAQPLNNFSQMICAQPGDSIAPCQPPPPIRSSLDYASCEDYYQKFCEKDYYSNIIFWNRPEDAECRSDIRAYNVYASARKGDEYFLLAENVRDTFYIDDGIDNAGLLSYARCYKIAAVDRSGNVGELSEELCVDNCPYYELPNIFTPNGDEFNNEFSAFSTRGYNCGEDGDCIPPVLKFKCARFVERVEFRVYNRWGKEVYSYEGRKGDEVKTIYIDWNGKDNSGVELATAIYFYIAEVTFDSVDPDSSVKTFKGWVHLYR